ncbi:hypothetical protein FN846DRAFT_761139, partial [Sphaerosporella brunnea]
KRRNAILREDCLRRQLDRCMLTHTHADLNVEACHILPHSLAAKTSYRNCIFWFMLAILLGADWQRRIWQLAGGNKSYAPTNGLALGNGMHTLFDRGLFTLRPVTLGCSDASRIVDVQLNWKTRTHTATSVTMLPGELDAQLSGDTRYRYNPLTDPRSIRNGDRFRLFTNDPEKLPLPSPVLLELHAALWALIGAVGLTETNKQ